MAHDPRWEAQDHQYARAYRNLQKAREEAARKNGYDSTRTRSDLKLIFCDRFGKDPYEWQLDVTEAILLGLDSVIIAGTGYLIELASPLKEYLHNPNPNLQSPLHFHQYRE